MLSSDTSITVREDRAGSAFDQKGSKSWSDSQVLRSNGMVSTTTPPLWIFEMSSTFEMTVCKSSPEFRIVTRLSRSEVVRLVESSSTLSRPRTECRGVRSSCDLQEKPLSVQHAMNQRKLEDKHVRQE